MNKIKKSVVISILCCVSVVLDIAKEFIPFINLPNGGSINISLIPIFVCGFMFDTKDCILCSFISFLLSSFLGLNNIFISIPQYFFDYIVPTIFVGLCSLFYIKKSFVEMELGIIFSMFFRTLSIILSGSIFWIESTMIAGSKEAFIFSAIYNLPYSFITLVVSLICVPIVTKIGKRYLI